jgi:hypothetical protein
MDTQMPAGAEVRQSGRNFFPAHQMHSFPREADASGVGLARFSTGSSKGGFSLFGSYSTHRRPSRDADYRRWTTSVVPHRSIFNTVQNY